MGSYNYDALHKNTPIVKRLWIPDPLAANQGYMNANIRPVDPPYINGYRNNPFQDCFLVGQAPGAQVPMMGGSNGLSHYGVTKYNLPGELHSGGLIPPSHLLEVAERDHYANAYANGLPFQWPVFLQPQRLTREPREPRIRGRRVRERRVREPVVRPEPEIREPVRALSTSQSPAQSPAQVPDAAEQPPLPGMIFGCTSDTYIECMQMKLFALPATNKSEVMRVAPGTRLFLYNYQAKELSGIFEATSNGDMDLEPDAFQGLFPAQVRVRCLEKCPNLPLKAFKEAMSENFEKKRNKFKYSLNDDQVRKLMTLFRQELKYWKRQRAREERLQPGYPGCNEVCYWYPGPGMAFT